MVDSVDSFIRADPSAAYGECGGKKDIYHFCLSAVLTDYGMAVTVRSEEYDGHEGTSHGDRSLSKTISQAQKLKRFDCFE